MSVTTIPPQEQKCYFYASLCDKIHEIHDSDIFQLKLRTPDKDNLLCNAIGYKTSKLFTYTQSNTSLKIQTYLPRYIDIISIELCQENQSSGQSLS